MGSLAPTVRRIAVLAFPDVQILDVVGPLEVFGRTARFLVEKNVRARNTYVVEVVGLARGPLRSSSGIELVAARAFSEIDDGIDTLLVAGGTGVLALLENAPLLQWLRKMRPRVRRIGSVCTGAFVLAQAGMLDGRRATTHWEWCARFAARYPQVKLEPDPIFIKDGRTYTSAGVTAGMDLALSMVEEDHGRDVALGVARELVVFLRRPGGQSQFSTQLSAQLAEGKPIQLVQAYIHDHLEKDLSVPHLADRVAMSPRHFGRVFSREIGVTPAQYIQRVRVEAARRQLEETARGMEEIASACGFGAAEAMRRAFLRTVRVPPRAYRERFHDDEPRDEVERKMVTRTTTKKASHPRPEAPMNIGILIFDDVEELDFVGPWEVLTSAAKALGEDPDPWTVRTIAQHDRPVRCAKGLRVIADSTLDAVSALDVVLVPGGQGTRRELKNEVVLAWLRRITPGCRFVTSVCSGALVLHAAGDARGKRVTTHWRVIDELRARGDVTVVEGVRFVRDGRLVTSAGVSAGIDMALWLVGELKTPAFARIVQHQIEYHPAPPYSAET